MEQRSDNSAFLATDDGEYIAYHQLNSKLNRAVGIIFLSGFKSDMTGTKATALEQFCYEQELGYVRFDYSGHGRSSGNFIDGTIGRWRQDVLTVIDNLAFKHTILVGSSLGGWLMLLAAMARPQKVKGLIGIAPAPDFTETLIWDKLKKSEKADLVENGVIHLPSEYCSDNYPITYKLIEEAREHLLLGHKIPIHCPVTLLHGMKDKDVPYTVSLQLAEQLKSEQVKLVLLKDGDHRMSEPAQLAELFKCVKGMVERAH